MSLPNKKRGEVSLPGYPGGRCIRFTHDVKERLQSAYSTPDNPNWVGAIYDGLSVPDIKMIRMIVETAKTGDDPIDLSYFDEVPDEDIVVCIQDALTLSLYGRTAQEQIDYLAKKQEEELEKKAERMAEKFRREMLAAGMEPSEIEKMISLSRLGWLDTGQDSSPTKSQT